MDGSNFIEKLSKDTFFLCTALHQYCRSTSHCTLGVQVHKAFLHVHCLGTVTFYGGNW